MDETPEQIHARLMGSPAPAEAPKEHAAPSKALEPSAPAEAPHEDQHGDDDAAMREAKESVNTYRNLYQLGRQEAEAGDTSLNRLTTAITDNALGVVGGHYAGKALRKGLGIMAPEGFLYNPEVPEIEKTHLPKAEARLGEYHNNVMDEIERRNALREQHIQEAHDLKNEAANRRTQYQLTERDLADARRQHLAAQMLEPEHYLPPEYSVAPEPTHERVGLTAKPLGGSAAEKYGLAHGLTEEEAKRVASASTVQKQNIPSQAEAFERLKSIAPNVMMSEQSPLLLDPAAQKAVEERYAIQMEQEAKARQEEEFRKAQRQAAAKQVAKARLEAEQRLKDLEQQRKEHLAHLQAAEKAHREHLGKTPQQAMPTPAERDTYQQITDQIDEMKKKIAQQTKQYGKYGETIAKIGTKIAPRFVPYYGAAVAYPQAEAAKKEFEKGNKIKGGLYALGSMGAAMQATANPFLMGAGDIMQIPAAGLSMYDIFNEKPAD